MSWPARASLLAWSAWAPGISSHADWQAWAQGERTVADSPDSPPVDFIPALLRRRLSRLSRLALATAHACVDDQQGIATVFASRHGELHRTATLLEDIARQEPLSPMAFSLSVHNTASGLYGISTGNTALSTAVAAGADTLAMSLVEAVGQLLVQEQVMLVYAEEPLPAIYLDAPGSVGADIPFGLALLLGRVGTGRDCALCPAADASSPTEPDGLAMVRVLASETGTAIFGGARHPWRWTMK